MKRLFTYIYLLAALLAGFAAKAQNTLGLLLFDEEQIFDGYNLIYPNHQSDIFLLDNCGEIVHTWSDVNDGRPGVVAQLLPNGDLLRCSTNGDDINNAFGTGGAGGVLEILSWEGEIKWKRVIADSIYRQHHEAMVMPNGNVLLIAWQRHFVEDIVENGFDTISNSQRELWSDSVMEIDVEKDSVIWQWNSWDHLVQDYDSTKLNFGLVEESLYKIDINYQEFSAGRQDFMHCNSIDYNQELDQILLSNRNYNELWIIDHSITTEQARGSQGDLLYRWGNNAAFGQGESQNRFIFYQHNAQWVDGFVPDDNPYYGAISFYNNFIDLNLSLGHIIKPVWDSNSSIYLQSSDGFFPNDFFAEFSHPDTLKNYSTAASSLQILPNGNALMHAGRQGRAFELNPLGEPVWEYLVPLRFGEPAEQGQEIVLSHNFTFQLNRYPVNYSAFEGKDLSPKGYLELNANEDFCTIYTSSNSGINLEIRDFNIFPNPASAYITIQSLKAISFELLDSSGRLIREIEVNSGNMEMYIGNLDSGIYFLKSAEHFKKVVIL